MYIYTEMACWKLQIHAEMSGDLHLSMNGTNAFYQGNLNVTFYDPSSHANVYCNGGSACYEGTVVRNTWRLGKGVSGFGANLSFCCLEAVVCL